jgi:hypothetical protein
MNLNYKFPLKYNKNIEPIKSVIIFNTLIFFYCYYVTYIITNSCNYLLLFLLQWFYTSANKGFIFGKYFKIYKILDYIVTIYLSFIYINLAYNILPFHILLLICLSLININIWQEKSPDLYTFIYRVNIWHLSCLLAFDLLIYFN